MNSFLRTRWVGGRHPGPRVGAAAMLTALVVLGCDSTDPSAPSATQPVVPTSPEELIQNLALAYRTCNYAAFENLFPDADDNAPYLHDLSEPLPNGQTFWDLTEELRIFRRMCNPENPLPGETPVPQYLWLQSITITLTQIGSFFERPDLYESPANPDGLDSNVWKAMECTYRVDVLFDTQSTTDYRVDGRVNFVVIEHLSKASGADRKFLIYRWVDLGCSAAATAGSPAGAHGAVSWTSNGSSDSACKTWGNVMGLYK